MVVIGLVVLRNRLVLWGGEQCKKGLLLDKHFVGDSEASSIPLMGDFVISLMYVLI